MKVYINTNDERWTWYKIDFAKIANSVAGYIGIKSDAECSVVLTNDTEIHALNRKYRNIDKPTNVLSFELEDDVLLGDIYISLDTVLREANEQKITPEQHTAHLVVHGLLHLNGYDHINDKDAKVMESTEIEILKKLGIANPYADAPSCDCNKCCLGGQFVSWIKKLKMPKDGLLQYFLMFLFGAVVPLGFAPFYMWWLALPAIGGAYYFIIRGGKKKTLCAVFLRILPFTSAYSIGMFWWVLHSIYVVPELAAQFAIWTIPAIVAIGIFGGIIFAVPFIIISCMRLNPVSRPVFFATVWTIVLWLREWLFTGFPWNPIANMTMPMPIVANSMSVWGALGLTFIIIGFVAAIAEFLNNTKNKLFWWPVEIFLMLGLLGGALGYANIKMAEENINVTPVIRIVQPAKSQSEKMSGSRIDAIARAEENVRNLIELGTGLPKPDLIIYPETTYPFVLTDTDFGFSKMLDTNVIIGATVLDNRSVYNALVLANPDGVIDDIYSKSHLVPFGEYSPMGFLPSPGHLTPGAGSKLMSVNLGGTEFVFAPAVCYEIVFSDSLIPYDAPTPNAIVNITNDTWFGATPGTYQHLDMVRRYAIESGVPVIRANYSGISAFVLSNGVILSQIPIGQVGGLDGFVWGAHNTLYRTIGRNGWMLIILGVACLCVNMLNIISRRK